MDWLKRSKGLLIWFPVILLPLCSFVAARIVRRPVMGLGTWFLGAVAEKLFFRFFLLRRIVLRVMKPVSAVLLVSVPFAGMHLFNLRTGQTLTVVALQMIADFCFIFELER